MAGSASIRKDLADKGLLISAYSYKDAELNACFAPKNWWALTHTGPVAEGEVLLYHPIAGYWVFQSIDLDFTK